MLLPKKYLRPEARVGDELEVFVYFDSEDRPIATTAIPKAQVGEIALLSVKELTKVGAFLDWGLDKDLFVPFKEMAGKKMAPGRRYAVQVRFDPVSCRIIGSNRFDRLAPGQRENTPPSGTPVQLIVYGRNLHGFQVLSADGRAGMLYHNEVFQRLEIGSTVKGYVGKAREDGKIDFRLRPPGRDAIAEAAEKIWRELNANHGFLPFTGKTDDQKIKGHFQFSKRTFKQALGKLYKERRITIGEDGIRLTE